MKVILYMAMSANGLIARKDDSTNWSAEELDAYMQKVKDLGNLIIGRKTYEIMQNDPSPDANVNNVGNPVVVVITQNKSFKNTDRVTFVSTPREALTLLESKNFTRALIAGGGKLIAAFLKAQLVDEIYLDIEPLLFGNGVPLISPSDFEYKLDLLGTKKLNTHTVQLHYKILK